MCSYVVASVDKENLERIKKSLGTVAGNWLYVCDPEQLEQALEKVHPGYIFFSHWRWIVPEAIVENYECVCFHMTDVPYGRGGSPLQNLILRGYKNTVLTVLRMETGLDTGPVYFKVPMSLDGAAHEIYKRANLLIVEVIQKMVSDRPVPEPQVGDPVIFNRRKPEQSEIPEQLSLTQLYDFIRMLDAPGYPHAYLEMNGLRIEFKDASVSDEQLSANVTIKKLG